MVLSKNCYVNIGWFYVFFCSRVLIYVAKVYVMQSLQPGLYGYLASWPRGSIVIDDIFVWKRYFCRSLSKISCV